jgi:RNA-directed DNA polymerase
VLNLIGQYLKRTSERGGNFWDFNQGISLGCPLSPLMGAFFLNALDEAAAKCSLFYVRFMDDILFLAPTRWKLRDAVKIVNQVLGSLDLEKHPDKTFIGRIERGFDFLGYHFSPAGLTVAKQTIANFIEKASRLYEQKRSGVSAAAALEMYVRRWFQWTRSGAIDPWPRESVRAGSGGGDGRRGRASWAPAGDPACSPVPS